MASQPHMVGVTGVAPVVVAPLLQPADSRMESFLPLQIQNWCRLFDQGNIWFGQPSGQIHISKAIFMSLSAVPVLILSDLHCGGANLALLLPCFLPKMCKERNH